MKVEVLGTGCSNCRTTAALIAQVAAEQQVPLELVKVEDLPSIMRYGVMATPAVAVDGKVVHAGGVPSRAKVAQWFSGPAAAGAAPAATAATPRCCG